MIHQNDRISIRHQIPHHAGQPHQVGGVKPDGGLVQHIQNPGGAVPDGAGKLHALPFPGGKGGGGAVQGQIAKPQIQKPFGNGAEGLCDGLRHGTHFFRKGGRNAIHPAAKLRKRHPAGVGKGDAAKPRRSGSLGKPGAMAVRADVLLQKFFHTLHALFILDFGKGIFHGVHGVEIGEIQLACLVGILGFVEDVPFFGGTVIDDFLFLVREIPEGNVGAHTHGAADIRHQ